MRKRSWGSEQVRTGKTGSQFEFEPGDPGGRYEGLITIEGPLTGHKAREIVSPPPPVVVPLGFQNLVSAPFLTLQSPK